MSVAIEAEVLLMPSVARRALDSFGLGLGLFQTTMNRLPTLEAQDESIVLSIRSLNGTRADLEWLVSADFIPASALEVWDRS